jgi:Putative beta barrel porin-7 (BBP7)
MLSSKSIQPLSFMISGEGGLIMAARRAEKLILGVLFVWSLILSAAFSFAAAPAPSEGSTEEIPTPAATEKTEIVTTANEGNITTEQCGEAGCTFEGVPLCSPPGRFWVRGDWMMWWTNGSNLPPLVTTSPQGTPQAQAGVLGQPGTSILFGNSTVYDDARAGVRITFGGWLDNCHRWGLEADWLTLGGKSINFVDTSNGNPILARPFFNVQTNAQDSQLKAYPGVVTGTVNVIGNDSFESVGLDLRLNLCCNSCGDCCSETCDAGCGPSCSDPCCLYYCRTDLLVGYRHYTMTDNLSIGENIFDTRVNSRFLITDIFDTRNEFNGTELGLNTELRRGRWSLGLLAKMAIGENHETATINGTTTIDNGQTQTTTPVGIYAVASNSGVHPKDQFVVIPQFGAELGCQVTCRTRIFAGYNLIYWAPVMRAGDQIDLNIDPRQFAPPVAGALPFPQYLARQTNFWAQGINIGAEYRF